MRAPLDQVGGRTPSGAEVSVARQLVERSGLVDALGPSIDAEVGRPRHLSLLGFLVASQLNAINRHHQGHLVEVARTLNALTDQQRQSLGVTSWDPDESYPRVARLFTKLCQVLESGESTPHRSPTSWPERLSPENSSSAIRWQSTGLTSRHGVPSTVRR